MPTQVPISILLPVYNGKHYLRQCIDSVLAQSWREFELIIADDGSTDGSLSIIEEYKDARIRQLVPADRLGLFRNLNRLLAVCQSDLIHILCQDDCLEPRCLEEEKGYFERYPNMGMAFTKSSQMDATGKITQKTDLHDLPLVLHPELSQQHFFYHGCIPSNLSTVCLRRQALEQVGGFNESFLVSGDYELWTRICRKWDMGVLHQYLIRIRTHDRQLSRAKKSQAPFVRENRQVRKSVIEHLPAVIQHGAKHFENRRYNVLDVHCAIRSLLSGRLYNFFKIFSAMGWSNFIPGLVYWVASLNNRLYRPEARFILPRVGGSPRSEVSA